MPEEVIVNPEVADVSEEVPAAGQEETEEVEETSEEETEESGEESSEESEEEVDEHDKTANERIRELVERSKKAEEELNSLKAKFEAEQESKKQVEKPFIEIDMGRVEADIATMYEQIDELRLDGKTVEAARIQQKIVKLLDAVDRNEELKQKWEAEQATKSTEETKVNQRLQELDDAAVFYQKQMNIPDDMWASGGHWLKAEFEKNPVLGRKFADIVDRQGSVAAIEWAHNYVVDNMGKEAEAAKNKKEEAKKKNIGGIGSASENAQNLKSFDDLMSLPSKDIIALEKRNPKLFNKLINDRLKRS